MKRTLIFTVFAAGFLTAGAAWAGPDCAVPEAERQSTDTLQKQLEDAGWQVKRIKIEDGCYEVYGHDEEGHRVEAYFDPQTLAMLEREDDD